MVEEERGRLRVITGLRAILGDFDLLSGTAFSGSRSDAARLDRVATLDGDREISPISTMSKPRNTKQVRLFLTPFQALL